MSSSDYSSFGLQQWPALLGIVLAGFALGLLFFGSLWLTTGKILHSRHPVWWVLGGLVLRLVLVLPAIYWLTEARWQKLLACLAGFIIARILVINVSARWQSPVTKPVAIPGATAPTTATVGKLQEESGHASKS